MTQQTLHTTRPFMCGRSRAVRIPKACRSEDTEPVINRGGDSLVIASKRSLRKAFFDGIAMLPDGFKTSRIFRSDAGQLV